MNAADGKNVSTKSKQVVVHSNISHQAFRRKMTGEGPTHRERSLEKVTCDLCGAQVNRQHLSTHQSRKTCASEREARANWKAVTHRERSLEKVTCDLCGAQVNRQHLPTHQSRKTCERERANWRATSCVNNYGYRPSATQAAEPADPTPHEYFISMVALQEVVLEDEDDEEDTTVAGFSNTNSNTKTPCPVPECPGKYKSKTEMRQHFRTRHALDTIVIEEEGRLPQCDLCGFFGNNVGSLHQATATCQYFAKKRKRMVQAKQQKQLQQQKRRTRPPHSQLIMAAS
jgi:hypothetical protein